MIDHFYYHLKANQAQKTVCLCSLFNMSIFSTRFISDISHNLWVKETVFIYFHIDCNKKFDIIYFFISNDEHLMKILT